MSAHLPECPVYTGPCCPWMGDCKCQCCCDMLRACEQRVREDYRANRLDLAHYEDGLQAARDAVAALSVDAYCGDWCVDSVRDDALAAIDALRNQSSDTGTKVLPEYDGQWHRDLYGNPEDFIDLSEVQK